MKFLCDRCKTRYSIGDDRVRGKILKIRCKNCGNVITVREGMSADAEAPQPVAPEHTGRAKKPTTVAPAALGEASDPARAVKDALEDPARGDRSRPAAQLRSAPLRGEGPPGAEAPDRAGPPRGDRAGGAGPGAPGPGAPAATAREPGGAATDRVGGRGQPGAGRRGGGLGAPRGEPVNALNAAFASAMAKPPPALEEEWYVSIDGDQAGPFSLSEAQGWVAQQPFEAELHCWSEGFDDWLPVDKVSHFRGLRKRPAAPVIPPPLPRGGGVPQRAAPVARAPVAMPTDDDPKPLFAATMASLERGAPVAPGSGPSLPSPATPSARATPPRDVVPRIQPVGKPANGARLPADDAGRGPGTVGDAGHGARSAQSSQSTKPAEARPAPARRVVTPSSGPARPGVAGDPFDTGEAGDAQTQPEAMPFSDSVVPVRTSQPGASLDPAPGASAAALTSPRPAASSMLHGTGASPAMATAATTAAAGDLGGGDDDLAIGEVSRVVKLADIVPTPRTPERPGAARRVGTATGSVGRLTGPNPALRSTASVAALLPGQALDGAPAAPGDLDPATTMAPIRTLHRRGLIALLGVAGVMVLGVIGAVILLVTTNDDPTGGSLGPVRGIDTSRPEDPITHRPIDPVGPSNPPPNPFAPRPTPHPRLPPAVGSNHVLEPPPGNSLRGDEIEDIARKYQDMTQRCYMRSQRGADAILVGDVKKIAVTLMIDKDGNVSDVQLSEHAADNLGKCLSGSIRGWKFRASSGGTFRFSLNFVSG